MITRMIDEVFTTEPQRLVYKGQLGNFLNAIQRFISNERCYCGFDDE